jgi:hypothetical protein
VRELKATIGGCFWAFNRGRGSSAGTHLNSESHLARMSLLFTRRFVQELQRFLHQLQFLMANPSILLGHKA